MVCPPYKILGISQEKISIGSVNSFVEMDEQISAYLQNFLSNHDDFTLHELISDYAGFFKTRAHPNIGKGIMSFDDEKNIFKLTKFSEENNHVSKVI